MSIINTRRFDGYAHRRLANRLGEAGVVTSGLENGGIGRMLGFAFDVRSNSGDAVAMEFAGLLVAIDEAMTDIEAAKPAGPLLAKTRSGSIHAERMRRTKPWEKENRAAMAEFDRIIDSAKTGGAPKD